jgi:hypothetical protein
VSRERSREREYRSKLRRGRANPDPAAADVEFEAPGRASQHQQPGTDPSLREGLSETLPVTRLGVGGALLKTAYSTNPVESIIESLRGYFANARPLRIVRRRHIFVSCCLQDPDRGVVRQRSNDLQAGYSISRDVEFDDPSSDSRGTF